MKNQHYTEEQFSKIWKLGHAILDLFNAFKKELPKGKVPNIDKFVDEQWNVHWHKYNKYYLQKQGNTNIKQQFFLAEDNDEPIINYDYKSLVIKYIL